MPALFEMVGPVLATRRYGFSPWNAGHLAERFALLTLIAIGEVIAGTKAAVGAPTQPAGWTCSASSARRSCRTGAVIRRR